MDKREDSGREVWPAPSVMKRMSTECGMLHAQVTQLEGALSNCDAALAEAEDEIERLQACFDQRNDALLASCKRNRELQARVETLEGASRELIGMVDSRQRREFLQNSANRCRIYLTATEQGESDD